MQLFSIISIAINMIVTVNTLPKITKGSIGFPEFEENPLLINTQNRTALFMPSRCSENELFYPGDQQNDWICDCRPGFVYEPDTDMCWPAYQRGPCLDNQYLILPKKSVKPICVNNPCITNNFVLFKGKCEMLGSTAPCGKNIYPSLSLWVNAATLRIECIQSEYNNQVSANLAEDALNCPVGCKRHFQGSCAP